LIRPKNKLLEFLMKTNEIKHLIIKRIEEGGFGNQWLHLTVIGDSDCCLMLSKHKVDLIPKYNVGWSNYSDLFIFTPEEIDEIRGFFLEELAKFPYCDWSSVNFRGGVLIDIKSFTLKLRGLLCLYSEKGEDLVFELAEIYDSNSRTKGITHSDVLISKFKLIDELSAIEQMNNCDIHEVLEIHFESHGTIAEIHVEISFRI
jgi:hypothetical protein